MVRAVVIAQLAVELGQGYTWAEVSGRDWKRKYESQRNVLVKAQAGGPPKDMPPEAMRWREMTGRRNMARDRFPGLKTGWTLARSRVGRPTVSGSVLHLFRCCCHLQKWQMQKRQVFTAGETCEEWIPNLVEVKLSPQKGECLIADKLITWKYFF